MLIKIDQLVNWDINPRQISKEEFDSLKKSIKKDPNFLKVNKPITYLDRETNKYIVIAGNMRFRVAKELGYKELECDVMDDVYNEDGSLKKKLIKNRGLKHNVEYGKYDKDLLANNFDLEDLQEFKDLDFEIGNIFFNIESLDDPEIIPDEKEINLPNNERAFTNQTFNLSMRQDKIIKDALNLAKSSENLDDITDNENSNGNSLEVICNYYLDNRF